MWISAETLIHIHVFISPTKMLSPDMNLVYNIRDLNKLSAHSQRQTDMHTPLQMNNQIKQVPLLFSALQKYCSHELNITF